MIDKTKLAKEVFDYCAELYQDKFMNFDLYNDTLDIFCNQLAPNSTVLDVGCGPGNISVYLRSKNPSFSIVGIDVSDEMIKLAKQNLPSDHFEVMDVKVVNQLNHRFDAIVCGFCLPYLSKEESLSLIKNAHSLLNDQGILYLSTMEGDYALSGIERKKSDGKERELYVHYHESKFLTAGLEKNGFELIHECRKTYPEQQHKSSTDLILIGKKTH